MGNAYDGFVSRHLNRRMSRPAARLLVHTPVSPNHVSFASLGVALGAFAAFVYGYHIVGALLTQASSVVDGIDGDLARAKGVTSAFGGFLDSILDRYSDALIILGLAIWAAGDEARTHVWVIGFLALAGTFAVTYTRARVDEAMTSLFDHGVMSIASRDIRLFVIMIGALAGQGLATLVVIAGLTNIAVLLRLIRARRAMTAA